MVYDVIVVGAGVMGLATAAELARRGRSVLVLEQFGIPHTLGSSHGDTRVTRTAYFEHPDYVPLVRRAHQGWERLCDETAHSVGTLTGGLYIGKPESDLIARSDEAAVLHGLDHERLSAEEIVRRWPQVQVPEGMVGFYEPACGVLFAERGVSAFAEVALMNGADIRCYEQVHSWSATGGSVKVHSDQGTYEADRLVIAAGSWTSRLLSDLGIPLKVTRQVVGWTAPAQPERFLSDAFPVCCLATDESFYYTIPILPAHLCPPRPGFKSACHDLGEEANPDQVDRGTTRHDAHSFLAGLKTFLPEAAGPVLSMASCLYTSTPDGNFVIDVHPYHPHVCFACGFSGHGFKFAPVIGEVLADLATENGRTHLPIGFLRLSRLVG
jgi:sarcosine oxidase